MKMLLIEWFNLYLEDLQGSHISQEMFCYLLIITQTCSDSEQRLYQRVKLFLLPVQEINLYINWLINVSWILISLLNTVIITLDSSWLRDK